MDDKQLELLQQEMMQQIDQEAEVEKNITESAQVIAQELLVKKRTRTMIDEKAFSLAYHPYKDEKENKDMICILAINEFHFKISTGNYRPFKIEAELDHEYSEVENLQMVVESFIRHVAGLIKPEEIQ